MSGASPSGTAFVEAHAIRRAAGVGRPERQRPCPESPSSVSMVTIAVDSCGAVWRASRTSHERRASKTTSATVSRSSSSAAFDRASSSWWRTSALIPRAPHLQSYASAAPRAPPSRRTGGSRPGRRRTGCVARAGRRPRRPGAQAARRSAPPRARPGPGCGPARRGRRPRGTPRGSSSERASSPASPVAPGPNRPREHRSPAGRRRSSRRSSRHGRGPAGRTWRRPGGRPSRATCGSAWMPA